MYKRMTLVRRLVRVRRPVPVRRSIRGWIWRAQWRLRVWRCRYVGWHEFLPWEKGGYSSKYVGRQQVFAGRLYVRRCRVCWRHEHEYREGE
jgi:hypothetical protein